MTLKSGNDCWNPFMRKCRLLQALRFSWYWASGYCCTMWSRSLTSQGFFLQINPGCQRSTVLKIHCVTETLCDWLLQKTKEGDPSGVRATRGAVAKKAAVSHSLPVRPPGFLLWRTSWAVVGRRYVHRCCDTNTNRCHAVCPVKLMTWHSCRCTAQPFCGAALEPSKAVANAVPVVAAQWYCHAVQTVVPSE